MAGSRVRHIICLLKHCQLITQSVSTISTWPALDPPPPQHAFPLDIPSLQYYLFWDKVRSMWLYSSSPEACEPERPYTSLFVVRSLFSLVTILFTSDLQCTLKGFGSLSLTVFCLSLSYGNLWCRLASNSECSDLEPWSSLPLKCLDDRCVCHFPPLFDRLALISRFSCLSLQVLSL